MKTVSLIIALCIKALFLPMVDSAPYFVSDDRVRDNDVTPLLGRGYSIMTNDFVSTCLMTNFTTTPSYNYDLSTYDLTRATSLEDALSGELFNLFAYPVIKRQISNVMSVPTDPSRPRTYFYIATMRIDRYYSSVQEELSPLAPDAQKILEKQDYVGFFQACGSSYVRSIRRAQEVTAIIKFESFRQKLAQEFATLLNTAANVNQRFVQKVNRAKFHPLLDSLEMNILGYGLVLTKDGAGSLVPNTLTELSEIMKYAFEVMTKGESLNGEQVGKVHGVEYVPWTDNTAFQVASQITAETVDTQVPRSLLEKAYHKTNRDITQFQESERANFKCAKSNYHIDKFGYCCEIASLYDIESRTFVNRACDECICKPTRPLEKSIVKSNMSQNAEFVARLDSALREKTNQLSALEKCATEIQSVPNYLDYNILKPRESALFDPLLGHITVRQLKRALDPKDDYSFIKHMGEELDEYQEMYFRRCISDLYGGGSSEVDATLFMSVAWQSHPRCTHMACLKENQRWSRNSEEGCEDSMIMGALSPVYSDDVYEETCALDSNSGDEESCRYLSADLQQFHTDATRCWKKMITPPETPIVDLLDHFCPPVVTNEMASTERIAELKSLEASYCR